MSTKPKGVPFLEREDLICENIEEVLRSDTGKRIFAIMLDKEEIYDPHRLQDIYDRLLSKKENTFISSVEQEYFLNFIHNLESHENDSNKTLDSIISSLTHLLRSKDSREDRDFIGDILFEESSLELRGQLEDLFEAKEKLFAEYEQGVYQVEAEWMFGFKKSEEEAYTRITKNIYDFVEKYKEGKIYYQASKWEKQKGLLKISWWNVEEIWDFDYDSISISDDYKPWDFITAKKNWLSGIIQIEDRKIKEVLPFEYGDITLKFNEFWFQIVRKNGKTVFLKKDENWVSEVEWIQYNNSLKNLWHNALIFEDKRGQHVVQFSHDGIQEVFTCEHFIQTRGNNTVDFQGIRTLLMFASTWGRKAICVMTKNWFRQLSDFSYDGISDPDIDHVMYFVRNNMKWFVRVYENSIIESKLSRSASRTGAWYKVWYFWKDVQYFKLFEDNKKATKIPFYDEKRKPN